MHGFLIVAHKAPLQPDFTLNDLPGSAGRLDVLCRCINAALFLSHGIRRDVDVFLVMQNQLTIRISGQHVKRLNPDERSTAALIKKALERVEHVQNGYVQSTPGIRIARSGLSQTLESLNEEGFEPVLLHEGKASLSGATLPRQPLFVLSDHMDFTSEELASLNDAEPLSVGPNIYPASHCIVAANLELDMRQAGQIPNE